MAKIKESESEALAAIAVHGMQEIKGFDIITMDLRKLKSAFADFFVICHGNTERQVEALADSVEDQIRKATGERPLHREGGDKAGWILLDYVNIIVHVFTDEKRAFYSLEELWGDGEIKKYESTS
jgi:ribosome-associated protein